MPGSKKRFSLWTAPAKIKRSYQFSIFFLLLIGYLAACPWLLTQWGSVSRVFVFVFTLPAAFFWGLRGGAIVALATPIPVFVIHSALGVPYSGGLIGPLFLLAITIIVGRMCDLSLRLEEELDKQDQAEGELQRHQTLLEGMIRERTAELSQANTELQQEIAERRQVANALRQSEEKYRSLVENTMDGYFIVEISSGRFLFLNQRSCQMFQYDMDRALTLTIWDVIDAKEHALVRERIRARIEGDLPEFTSNAYTAVRNDGSMFRVEISSSLITYRGQPVMQGIIRDVTETKHLELQLQQAQKFEAIGTLAGGVAHDFNNLLMGIQGHISLLTWELDASSSQIEHIEAIEDHIKSATHLTQQLLGFARGGKYEVKPVEINELVTASATMFGRTRKEVRIHTKIHPQDLVVEADRQQIEQVLLNIFINAWQAMPGGGDLYVETSADGFNAADRAPQGIQSGQYAKISITDTGIGMDDKIRQRIFDPFFTTKEKNRGTGLGMASAYGILRNHGGTITVHSEKGHGATFDLYLPRSDRKVSPRNKTIGKPVSGSGTILLVDDERMIEAVASEMLKKLGYEVITASSGQQAIDIVSGQGERIDLVILDLIMPGMDGGETFDRIRAMRPQLPIVLSSGYAIDGQAAEIMRRGCNGFIQKPFSMSKLSVKVREVLDTGHP